MVFIWDNLLLFPHWFFGLLKMHEIHINIVVLLFHQIIVPVKLWARLLRTGLNWNFSLQLVFFVNIVCSVFDQHFLRPIDDKCRSANVLLLMNYILLPAERCRLKLSKICYFEKQKVLKRQGNVCLLYFLAFPSIQCFFYKKRSRECEKLLASR